MFEAILSIDTIESITIIDSLSIEATGPLLTSPGAGIGFGVGVGLASTAVLVAALKYEEQAY